MPKIPQLRLLGPFEITGKPGNVLRRKERAILAYLAQCAHPKTRHELAYLFCQSAANPGRTLRLSLSRLRKSLGESVLISQGEAVLFNRDSCQTDFSPFQELLAGSQWQTASLETLERIIPLYRGEFLEGLYLPDAPEFDIWLVGQRSYWAQLYERGALAWLKRLSTPERYVQAIPIAQRLVQQNPLLEEAHFHLIWLYAHTNQPAAARAQFDHCQAILETELAVEPGPALQALHAELLANRLAPRMAARPQIPVVSLTPTPPADFVGRESEWQTLNRAWDQVRQGHRRALIIKAEAGGGKTRLVQEWAKTLPDKDYYYGPCYESSRNLAYQPWLPLLDELHRHLNPASIATLPLPWRITLAHLLPALASQDDSAEQEQPDQLFAAVHALLMLAERPLVLFLDDWQWADAASLQLLQYLVARRTRVLLIGAYRTEEADDNPDLLTLLRDWSRNQDVDILALAPFAPETVSKLIRILWPKLPDGYREPHLRDQLWQATGGNPLFVSEIVRELAGTDQLPDRLPVPPSLHELVQRRLHQLPTRGRQVLESLAIMDQPADFDLIRQVSGRSENDALEALELGLRWRLLRTTAETLMVFSHDLIRQAVRQQLSPIRRQILHRRTATALSHLQAPAATLAYHWGQAGDREQEARYAAVAGSHAAALYAYQDAAHYLQRALDLISDPQEQASLLLQLGEVLVVLGRWEQARSLYEQGLALAADGHVRAAIQAEFGALLEYKGEYDDALQMVLPAVDFYKGQEDWEQLVRLLGYLGRILWRQGLYQEALTTYENALTYTSRLASDRQLIRLHNNIGLVYWRQQRYEQAMEHFHQSRRMAETHQHKIALAIALGNIGNVHKDLGEFNQTLQYYQQALELDTELGNKMGMARHLGNLGVLHNDIGMNDKALEYFERALQLDEELGHLEGVARHIGNLGTLHHRVGRYVETLFYFGRALDLDLELGNRAGVALHVGNIGSMYKLLGEPEAALACLVYAARFDSDLGNKTGLARHLGNLADLFLSLNRTEEALAWCERAIRLQQIWVQDYHLCWNLWLKGVIQFQLGDYKSTVSSLQAAEQMAETVQRQDVIAACQALTPHAKVLTGELSWPAGLERLGKYLAQTTDQRYRAAILYELWRLDPVSSRQIEAREAYLALLRQSPTEEARQRSTELGAMNLPDKAAAPPLPNILLNYPVDLNSLLDQVNQHLTLTS